MIRRSAHRAPVWREPQWPTRDDLRDLINDRDDWSDQ